MLFDKLLFTKFLAILSDFFFFQFINVMPQIITPHMDVFNRIVQALFLVREWWNEYLCNSKIIQRLIFLFVVAGEICSHTRVHDLFLESLKYTSLFWATKCASYDEIHNEICSPHGQKALMGSDIGTLYRPLGLYYLETNGESPYCKYHT